MFRFNAEQHKPSLVTQAQTEVNIISNFAGKILVTATVALSALVIGANASADTYTVKSGDTLSEIAVKHDMELKDILENNNFENIHLIHIGDKVELDKNEKNEPKKEEVNQEETVVEEAPVVETPVVEQVVSEQPVSSAVKDADYAAQRMADATGLSKTHWAGVIFRESGNNPNITNATGHFGFFQIDPIHGLVDTSVDGQINKAIEIYNAQGGNAWEAW